VRLATWNVNGLRARLEFVKLWLAERRPDIVGLQELKLQDELFPHDEFAELGYRAVVHGQKSWNGVAILGRHPIEPVQIGLPGEERFGSRLVAARSGGIDFTTVYCPNGKNVGHDDYPAKLCWFDTLLEWVDATWATGSDLVLCGDFNICFAPIDSWSEEQLADTIFHTQEERLRLRRLLDWGLVDLFRDLHPQRQAFSWWDYRGGAFHRRRGLRIDLLLGTGVVLSRARSAEIDREWRKKRHGLTPSDHAPVIVDLV
jgi:exodeoxyribonuclease-3